MAISKWIGKLIIDLFSLFLVYLPWIILQAIGKPYHRGFFCNDDSIKYPYKDNTVTNTALTVPGFIVPFVVFAITEGVHFVKLKKSNNPPQPYEVTRNCSMPKYFVMLYRVCLIFLFGMAVQQTITNIGKFSIGRLRPHFLSVCKPNYATLNCTVQDGFFAYIEEDVCTGANDHKMLDSRLSFPSGHSSFAAFVAVFLMLYLQARMTWKGSKLLRHFLQAVLIYLAIFVCLSRISDYKHHWSDVLSGAFLGVFVAALTAIHLTNYFRDYWRSQSDEELRFQVNSSMPGINQSDLASV